MPAHPDPREARICFDCAFHRATPIMSEKHPQHCVHFTPEYWVEQGYTEYWGDAAVNAWPICTILRKQDAQGVRYIILNEQLRRPVELWATARANGTVDSWGAF